MDIQKICVEKTYPPLHGRSGREKDFAAFLRSRIWPLGTTQRVAFMNSPADGGVTLNPSKKSTLQSKYEAQETQGTLDIRKAIQEIVETEYNPILDKFKFEFVDDVDKANIRINFDSTKGSYSVIGREASNVPKTEPTMNFGWFDVGTVLHEFGHALGLVHEHQNPKGNDIQWDVPALNAYMKRTQGWDAAQVQTQVIKKYNSNQLNGSTFDPNSIMLYFYPADLTTNNKGTTHNTALSAVDKKTISDAYSNKNVDRPSGSNISVSGSRFAHLDLILSVSVLTVVVGLIMFFYRKKSIK